MLPSRHTRGRPHHLAARPVHLTDRGGLQVPEPLRRVSLLPAGHCGLQAQLKPRQGSREDRTGGQSPQVGGVTRSDGRNLKCLYCRQTIGQLGSTVQEVDKLQGKVRQSLKELKIFLNGMGTVADNAVKELNNLKFK